MLFLASFLKSCLNVDIVPAFAEFLIVKLNVYIGNCHRVPRVQIEGWGMDGSLVQKIRVQVESKGAFLQIWPKGLAVVQSEASTGHGNACVFKPEVASEVDTKEIPASTMSTPIQHGLTKVECLLLNTGDKVLRAGCLLTLGVIRSQESRRQGAVFPSTEASLVGAERDRGRGKILAGLCGL